MEFNTVIIEHCKSCKNHSWCTNHDEQKYQNYLEKVKLCIEATCPEVSIFINQNPQILMSLLYPDSTTSFSLTPTFPRLGSFEVYFRNKVIFSKLKSGRWPNPTNISKTIRNTLDGIVVFQTHQMREENSRPVTAHMRKSRSANTINSKH